MTNVYLPAFYLGVKEELEKAANLDVHSMPVNENILPSINKQTKWRYVRTKDGLRLTDGNLVYSFAGFPEDYPMEDTRVQRHSDDNILNFENEALSKGTAQIHRASPDNIYLTLATGTNNPTFMLQHEGGKNWRYSPAKKFMKKLQSMREAREKMNNVNIDTGALMEGMQDTIKEAADFTLPSDFTLPTLGAGHDDLSSFTDFLHNIGSKASNAVGWIGAHPITAGAGAYALAQNSPIAHDKKPFRALGAAAVPSIISAMYR